MHTYYFLLLIPIYKMDNLTVIAIITIIVTLFILMIGVSIILSTNNINKKVTQRVWP